MQCSVVLGFFKFKVYDQARKIFQAWTPISVQVHRTRAYGLQIFFIHRKMKIFIKIFKFSQFFRYLRGKLENIAISMFSRATMYSSASQVLLAYCGLRRPGLYEN
jgi:hypothetical protein